MKKLHLLVVFLLLSFASCAKQPQQTTQQQNFNSQPLWINNPNINGKKGAVGIAGRTYDLSVSTQRKLAISRALDELSLQTNVHVELLMNKEETTHNNTHSVNTKDKSKYSANANISAHIEATWTDKSSREIYIWMVLNK